VVPAFVSLVLYGVSIYHFSITMLGQDKTYDFLSPLCALLLLFQGDNDDNGGDCDSSGGGGATAAARASKVTAEWQRRGR
jgi:hypothetical protein